MCFRNDERRQLHISNTGGCIHGPFILNPTLFSFSLQPSFYYSSCFINLVLFVRRSAEGIQQHMNREGSTIFSPTFDRFFFPTGSEHNPSCSVAPCFRDNDSAVPRSAFPLRAPSTGLGGLNTITQHFLKTQPRSRGFVFLYMTTPSPPPPSVRV